MRYVIGKLTAYCKVSHAWVLWNDGRHLWILDPTVETKPIRADRVSDDRYIAHYSYGRDGPRRHKRATFRTVLRATTARDVSSSGWRRFYREMHTSR